ncbi:type I 3-dehydroquinate dehydratase [Desulfoprunum benzoelyticum]|uniref:3-dehydroquinate dehydratase n=1 Tax=Desulfoprunum benzoelyticum TaxID=1506996 RepID=A0A840ULZ8_9BACT|nr:type I 3-dehydroquinate dehydratase [Desulfoprunum benzoelyticum]MBB5346625.1 3-dehydroquinate dehydratase-1 [Desulfoprunum benzoelyticum]MBM9529129.1 type I 3-dehydroquinate dehydratase [Desulfoprunum benzoelyticum]
MRQQSRKQIRIRNVVIGGPLPLICLPLVAATRAELIAQAQGLAALQPDLVEWRADGFGAVEDVAACLSALDELRRTIGEMPLIFTCRIDREGGMRTLAPAKRLEIIVAAIASGAVDLVDIELGNGREFIDAVRQHTRANRVALILSYHNFKETPDETFIYNTLLAAWQAGADIPKLAVMPREYRDVLVLLSATDRARNSVIDSPLVTISMGEQGAVSRVAGGLFGSDITFAVGTAASAPGQIPIAQLRSGMAVLFGNRQGA